MTRLVPDTADDCLGPGKVARGYVLEASPVLGRCVHAALVLSAVILSACGSSPAPVRYSDSTRIEAPDTLGAPDEGMPDPKLGKGGEVEPFGSGPPSREAMGPLQPGWVGVELQANRPGEAGVPIVDVVRRSPAAEAGLARGDIVLQVNGEPVTDPVHLVRRIRKTAPGTPLSLGISRGGRSRLVALSVQATPNPDELLRRRFVGAPAPALDALTPVTSDIDLNWSKLRGRVVVLEFWAPWCGVCRLVHGRLNEWQAQWSNYGLEVIGIAALDPETARSFATRFGITYRVAADASESTFRAYDVFAVPSLFLVDRQGRIVDAATGYSSQRLAGMEGRISTLIGERPAR